MFEAIAVRIPRNIEPVTAPAFAVVRRGKEFVDQSLPRAWSIVRHKLGRFCGRGRQSGQVEISPAQKRLPVGSRRGFEALFLTALLEKKIDRILQVCRDGGHRGLDRQLERPVVPRFRRDLHVFQRGQCGSIQGLSFGN